MTIEGSTNILDIPPEVLELVFQNLSYSEIDRIRPTCQRFNAVGINVLRMGLQRLRSKANPVIKNFFSKLSCLNIFPYIIPVNSTSAEFITLLSDMFKVLDAVTSVITRESVIYFLTAQFMDKISVGLDIVSKETLNSLVAIYIFRSIYDCLRNLIKFMSSSVNIKTVTSRNYFFQSIVILVNCLPIYKIRLLESKSGMVIQCKIVPIFKITKSTGKISVSAAGLIRALLTLYIQSMYGDMFKDQPRIGQVNREVKFKEVEMAVFCTPDERSNTNSFEDFMRLKPPHFRVTLRGTFYQRPQIAPNGVDFLIIEDDCIYTFSTPGCPPISNEPHTLICQKLDHL